MKRITFMAVLLSLFWVQPSDARHYRHYQAAPTWGFTWTAPVYAPRGTRIVHRHHYRHHVKVHKASHYRYYASRPAKVAKVAKVARHHEVSRVSRVSRDSLIAPLAAKVAEITSRCGSHLISGIRHTFIAGTRHMSLHAYGKAADVSGNPSCIYANLKDWKGGYSVDYRRVAHVHISYDPDGRREWGARFVHGGGHRHYAHHHRRHHHHYARA